MRTLAIGDLDLSAKKRGAQESLLHDVDAPDDFLTSGPE
jgi:hypothetical protein